MTFTAKHRPAYLGLERDLVVLAAVVAHDLEPRWSISPGGRLF